MSAQEIDGRIARLVEWYGDGSDGSTPTPEQWRRLLERPAEGAPTLVNLFKMRERAVHPGGSPAVGEPMSGQDAFARYSAVSVPAIDRVGGRFLLAAPFASSLVGEDEDWDLFVAGSYPDNASLLALFEDAEYREAFLHRRAACARVKVFVVG